MITDYFFDERLRVKYGKIAEEKFGSKFHFYPDDKEEFEEYDKNLKIFKLGLDPKMEITCCNGVMKAGELPFETQNPSQVLREIMENPQWRS